LLAQPRVWRPVFFIYSIRLWGPASTDSFLNLTKAHRHFPNLMDCRPIDGGPAMEAAGFTTKQSKTKHMWVPFEIVLGSKEA
jgi:hypothetical protein